MPKKVVRCYQDKDQPANMQYKLQSFLLEKEKLVSDFQQWWEAVRDIPLGREKEYRELQTMQEELEKATAETAAKAQARCLQEEALLERQLNDPAVSMLGEREEKELKRKAQALEVAAERHTSQLCCLRRESLDLHRVPPAVPEVLGGKDPPKLVKNSEAAAAAGKVVVCKELTCRQAGMGVWEELTA